MQNKLRMTTKKAVLLLALMADVNGGVARTSLRRARKEKNNNLNEDIEFWTRMTQAMGSMVRLFCVKFTLKPSLTTPTF